DGLPAHLVLLPEDALDRGVVELAALGDLLVVDGGEREAHGVTARGVLGLHGVTKVLLEPGFQSRGGRGGLSACDAWLPCACGVLPGARSTRAGGPQRGSQPAGSSC